MTTGEDDNSSVKREDIEKEASVVMVSLFRESMIAEAYFLFESILPYCSDYSQIQLNTMMCTLLEYCYIKGTSFDDVNNFLL